MQQRLSRLALITAIGMYLVLLAGALVTKTDSGRGCGDDWPLCNGKFVPAYTIESMIEYSHRFVTGIEGILVVMVAVGVWKYRRYNKQAVAYSGGALFFTVLQALLGAAAVKWPQSDAVLSLHFGFSLLAVTFCVLLVFALTPAVDRAYSGDAASTNSSHPASSVHYGQASVLPSFRLLVWGTAIYSYIVIYLGAYVRHTASQGGCIGWPLCNGEVIPELSGATGVAFVHRVAALLLFILITLIMYIAVKKEQDRMVRRLSQWVFGLTLAQVLSGGLVVGTMASEGWHLLASLMHTSFITGAFALLFYLCIFVRPVKRSYHSVGGSL
jgi:heme a synthase